MDEPQAPPHSVDSEPSKRALPRFGEAIGDIEMRFGPNGILGLVLIDASGFAKIAPDLQIQQDGAADTSLCGGHPQRGRDLDSLQ